MIKTGQFWSLVWAYIRGRVRVKVTDVQDVVATADLDQDGYISLGEAWDAIKSLEKYIKR